MKNRSLTDPDCISAKTNQPSASHAAEALTAEAPTAKPHWHTVPPPPSASYGRRQFLAASVPLAVVALTAATAIPADASSPSSVLTVTGLRNLPVPTTPDVVTVQGFSTPGDGGGGQFLWNSTYSTATGVPPDDGGTYLLPAGQSATTAGRWQRIFSGAVNPKWFGARGDNTGRTPQDDAVSITSAPWNVWPSWTSGRSGLGMSAGAPFVNTDSWDTIGTQLALLSVGQQLGEVAIPGGTYQLTQPLYYISQMHATLRGAGMYQTVLTKKSGFFNTSTTSNSYPTSVINLYHTGGVPAVIRDLALVGTSLGATTPFIALRHINTNGVRVIDCWLTSSDVGIDYYDSCSDDFVTGCASEYCSIATIRVDSTSDVVINDNSFWQSATSSFHYTGILSDGNISCSGNRFYEFGNASISSTGPLLAVGNHFLIFSGATSVINASGPSTVISGNRMVGGTLSPMVNVGSASGGAVVTGNEIEQTGNHACLNILQGSKHCNVTGNTLLCNTSITIAEGALLISVLQGINYSGGCSGCLISSNVVNLANGIAVNTSTNTVVNNLLG